MGRLCRRAGRRPPRRACRQASSGVKAPTRRPDSSAQVAQWLPDRGAANRSRRSRSTASTTSTRLTWSASGRPASRQVGELRPLGSLRVRRAGQRAEADSWRLGPIRAGGPAGEGVDRGQPKGSTTRSRWSVTRAWGSSVRPKVVGELSGPLAAVAPRPQVVEVARGRTQWGVSRSP